MFRHMILIVLTTVVPSTWTMRSFPRSLHCPNVIACACEDTSIDCSCSSETDLIFQDIIFHEVKIIRVSNCRKVSLKRTSMAFLRLRDLTFRNVQELFIEQMAFAGVYNIDHFSMVNIGSLNLDQYAFHGLQNVSKLEFVNVTMEVVRPSTIAGFTNVQQIIVSNSHVGSVQNFGFLITNASFFRMENTFLQYLHNASMYFDHVDQIELYNNTYRYTDDSSFSMMNVGTFKISNCHFAQIHPEMFLAKDTGTFVFENSIVDAIGERAFYHVQVLHKVSISHNTFRQTEKDSLVLSLDPSPYLQLKMESNAFFCNCSLLWLWEDMGYHKYDMILKSGYCYAPENLETFRLVDVIPSISPTTQKCETIGVISDADNTDKQSFAKAAVKEFQKALRSKLNAQNDCGSVEKSSVSVLIGLTISLVYWRSA